MFKKTGENPCDVNGQERPLWRQACWLGQHKVSAHSSRATKKTALKKKQFKLQIGNNRRNVTAFKAAKTPGAWWDGKDTIGLSCYLALQSRKPEPRFGCKWRKMPPQGESPAVWGQQQQQIHWSSQGENLQSHMMHEKVIKSKSWVWKVARQISNYSRCAVAAFVENSWVSSLLDQSNKVHKCCIIKSALRACDHSDFNITQLLH